MVPAGMLVIWGLSMPVILTLLGRTGPPIQVQSLPPAIPFAPLSMRAIGIPFDLLPFDTLYVITVLSVAVGSGSVAFTPHLWKFTM